MSAIANAIVPQISLPTKGTWSNNTMPFTGNYYPTQLTGTGLVSKTALDYVPRLAARTANIKRANNQFLIEQYLIQNAVTLALR
jgi:hypothetical protein